MLALALLTLTLNAGSPAPGPAHADPVDPGSASQATSRPHDLNLHPNQSQTPPGVVPSGTVPRMDLDQQRQQARGAATDLHERPVPACTQREARAGHCLRRPSRKASTRSGQAPSTPRRDSAPPATSP